MKNFDYEVRVEFRKRRGKTAMQFDTTAHMSAPFADDKEAMRAYLAACDLVKQEALTPKK